MRKMALPRHHRRMPVPCGAGWSTPISTPAAEVTRFTLVDDVAGSLNGTYIVISNSLQRLAFYLWDLVGPNSPPSAGQDDAEAIGYSQNATANDIALAFEAGIAPFGTWTMVVSGNNITLTDTATGTREDAVCSPEFTVTILTQGA